MSQPSFERIFLQNIPLIDVRAPVEFAAGHFPRSVNLPLMMDEERRLVGIEYKTAGQAAAIALGHELVSDRVKAARVARWREFVERQPQALLYCFRGGLRSQISAQWLNEAGVEIDIIPGGYKAMRNFLLESLATLPSRFDVLILAGRTGGGKTRFLREAGMSAPFLDLEQVARHRGSAFGAIGPLGTQPSQVTFENAVAVELLKQAALANAGMESGAKPVLMVEDESRSIGAVQIPEALYAKMESADLIVLERTLEERVAAIVHEYVLDKVAASGGDWVRTGEFMIAALDRIVKKLGGLNHQRIRGLMVEAFGTSRAQLSLGHAIEVHGAWVQELLKHYYDPLYDRNLKRRADRVRFQGNESECLEYLKKNLRRK